MANKIRWKGGGGLCRRIAWCEWTILPSVLCNILVAFLLWDLLSRRGAPTVARLWQPCYCSCKAKLLPLLWQLTKCILQCISVFPFKHLITSMFPMGSQSIFFAQQKAWMPLVGIVDNLFISWRVDPPITFPSLESSRDEPALVFPLCKNRFRLLTNMYYLVVKG